MWPEMFPQLKNRRSTVPKAY